MSRTKWLQQRVPDDLLTPWSVAVSMIAVGLSFAVYAYNTYPVAIAELRDAAPCVAAEARKIQGVVTESRLDDARQYCAQQEIGRERAERRMQANAQPK